MGFVQPEQLRQSRGFLIVGEPTSLKNSVFSWLDALGLKQGVECSGQTGHCHFWLNEEQSRAWAPANDSTQLCAKLAIQPLSNDPQLELEIAVAMLISPLVFQFASYEEFTAAVHIRRNIVNAAKKTELAFDTSQAERPADCWEYSEAQGFTIKPGKSLIDALKSATQPDATGTLYSFSCYRATEYVTLLAIAQELAIVNPGLLHDLQKHCEREAIKSRKFHDTFLHEYGSIEAPLPERYYIPGDRVWFRNPDLFSSDVAGYEGSWVFYLGSGLFSNFWKHDQPYTLTSKCVEIFHWRHGVTRDARGEPWMDEDSVEAHVRETLDDPLALDEVLGRMLRFRDPSGIFAEGGCIDTSRECPRRVCPGTSNIVLPEITRSLAC